MFPKAPVQPIFSHQIQISVDFGINSVNLVNNFEDTPHLKKTAFAFSLQKSNQNSEYTVLCKSNANEFRRNSWLFGAFRRNFARYDISTKISPHFRQGRI